MTFVSVFEHVLYFDHRMIPLKLCDDIYNDSGVILFTDRQTDRGTVKVTDTTENNRPMLAARVVKS